MGCNEQDISFLQGHCFEDTENDAGPIDPFLLLGAMFLYPEAMDSKTSAREKLLFRWDLDKTYLRTEFDSISDLVRTAFESASKKRTIPGAAALLREIGRTEPAGIFILSGSPTQLRGVIELKLRSDGIHWDRLDLKPQLQHLIRGRFRFLRDQVGYKLECLLRSRSDVPHHIDEYLFGDDAEADAFIYSLYADIGRGAVGEHELLTVLELAGAYVDAIPRIVALARNLPRGFAARRIFIHLDRASAPSNFDDFGLRVCPFHNYLQPSLVLFADGVISVDVLLRVTSELVVNEGFTFDAMVASYRDLAQRGYLGGGAIRRLKESLTPSHDALFPLSYRLAMRAVAELENSDLIHAVDPGPPDLIAIDYASLYPRDKARAHVAKLRSTGLLP